MRSLSFLFVACALMVSSAAQAAPCVSADGSDPTAPADAPGRGVADWAAHHGHVMKGAGLSNASKLVGYRMQGLTKVPKPIYARIYADMSILLVNCARISN